MWITVKNNNEFYSLYIYIYIMCTSDSIKMGKEEHGIILLKCSYATHLI